MNPEAALPTRRLEAGASIVQAQPWHSTPVSLDSPALAVMTDLGKVKAATTSPATTLAQAEQTMIYQGVRMLFVVSEMPSLVGLITSTDLGGDRAVRVAQERRLRYSELTVAEVMTGLSMLDAIELDSMKSATVRNLVATLKVHGRDHLLVVEGGTGAAPQHVRGVISRAQIERQLGTRIDIVEVAGSFAELGQMLR
jgi:CBS domain-containing protein